jgi:hypothetical protein
MPSADVKAVQQLAAKLPNDDLWKCVGWMARLAEKRDRDVGTDDSGGIPLRSVQKSFRKLCCDSRGRIAAYQPSMGATVMFQFYQEIRVKGCRMGHAGGDMLLVQWWLEKGAPIVDFTRQLIAPRNTDTDDEVWALSLQYRYLPMDAPPAFKPVTKWFRSLHDEEKYNLLVFKSKVISHLDKRTPCDVRLKFQNVE